MKMQESCLQLGGTLSLAVKRFMEGDTQYLCQIMDKNNSLLTEVFKSTDITVDILLNSRICRHLTYVQEFSQSYCEQVEAIGQQGEDEHYHMMKKLSSILESILKKWKNYI